MSKSLINLYESFPWVMDPAAIKAFAETIANLPESSDVYAIKIPENNQPKALNITEGIAKIKISGYLLESVPWWFAIFGIDATAYSDIVDQIAEAVDRDDVESIELDVDSPGGTVAGVISAADAIYSARQHKPLKAVVNNLAASGAYWLASQAQNITASDINALIGSIGVYTWFVDDSKYQEDRGIKVIVVRSGDIKGMAIDKVTGEQLEAVQEYIDDTADNFISQVARGRGVNTEKIEELATGQLWIANKAKNKGLIDSVIEAAMVNVSTVDAEAVAETMENNSSVIQELIMDGQENNQVSAEQIESARSEGSSQALETERDRIKAINEKFGDDLEFANTAISEGWTMEKANAEYVTVLREKIKENKAQASEQKAEGAEAISSGDSDAGSAGDFITEALELAEEKGISKTAAMKQLKRKNPKAYEDFRGKCETDGQRMYAEAV